MRELQSLIQGAETKLVQLTNESSEHGRVLDSLKAVPGDRKAFRLIGGVLVERTAAEVIPAVESNRAHIDEAVETLRKTLVEKRARFIALQV